MIIPILLLIRITYNQDMEFNTCMDEKPKHENCHIHTKRRKETISWICRTFFLLFFRGFNKQNMLVNNKNINVRKRNIDINRKHHINNPNKKTYVHIINIISPSSSKRVYFSLI